MEDSVSAKEAIDVKKGRKRKRKKKESSCNGWKEWRRSKCEKRKKEK